ncbi:LamG-like jellyroll fold domain-containing protein [Mucilaginibacter sp. P25]|uniref:Ig-like domain (Group 2) n=1 Tax=Mucilaginibacter gossypii TaxID=551996 RepID=A0A1G8LY40_9SPHI|nr:LamG-like jellyroll fold domain-containing protein [Mucilaginibacter gossypii]SDI60588.1 Ig-like domain (group 2) [Mucilaginibacter gossypii]
MKKFYPLSLLVALYAFAHTSCTKIADQPKPVTDSTKTLSEISLRDTLTMYTGQAVQLDVKVRPINFDTTKLVWLSSDTSIITVSKLGRIEAKGEGNAKVSVSNAEKTKSISCIVTVKDSLKVGLIAYYPFGANTSDVSGNGNNGSGYNLTQVADRFGNANSAYYFNGFNSYIVVKDKQTLRLSHTDFTITTWVKLDAYNNSFASQIIAKRLPGLGNGWNLSISGYDFVSTGQGGLGLVTFNEGASPLTVLTSGAVALNNWHMVTSVYNYTTHTLSLYIDGVKDSTFDGFASPNITIGADAYIGKDNPDVPSPGYFLKGALDDMRLYDRVLSDKEIKKLYTAIH